MKIPILYRNSFHGIVKQTFSFSLENTSNIFFSFNQTTQSMYELCL